MRSYFRFTLIALGIGFIILFAIIKGHDYYLCKVETRFPKIIEKLPVQYPYPDRPIFIFDKKHVSWKVFFPFGDTAHFPGGYKIISSFSPAFPNKPTDQSSKAKFTAEEVVFPSQGEYYLYTNAGYLKVLILKKDCRNENIFKIFAFIARNSVHSRADYRFFVPCKYPSLSWNLILFGSVEPLKVHCRGAANITISILSSMGYKARAVDIYKSEKVGHDILEVSFPKEKKWVMLDPDYGCYCVKDGAPLSIQEIAYYLREGIRIDVVDPVRKKALKPIYNLTPYQPPFSFRREMLSDQRMVQKERYLQLLSDYTNKIVILDRGKTKIIYKKDIPNPVKE